MLRSLAVVALVSCSSAATPPPRPLARPQVESPTFVESRGDDPILEELSRAMAICDAAAVERLVDLDELSTRIAAASHGAMSASRVRPALTGQAGAMMCQLIGNSGTYRHLRTHTIDGKQRPLFRAVFEDGGYNYHFVELGRRGAADTRLVDVSLVYTGELLSQRLANSLSEASDGVVVSIQLVQTSLTDKDYAAATEAFEALPANIRKTKPMMLARMRIAADLGDHEDYKVAEAEYAVAFPDEPTIIPIDAAKERGEYTLALDHIERLDKWLGGDPYLDVIRADRYSDSKDETTALARARRATEREPTLVNTWWSLLTMQSSMKDYKGAIVTLEVLRDRFSAKVDSAALGIDERFVELVASEVYTTWWASTRK